MVVALASEEVIRNSNFGMRSGVLSGRRCSFLVLQHTSQLKESIERIHILAYLLWKLRGGFVDLWTKCLMLVFLTSHAKEG